MIRISVHPQEIRNLHEWNTHTYECTPSSLRRWSGVRRGKRQTGESGAERKSVYDHDETTAVMQHPEIKMIEIYEHVSWFSVHTRHICAY